MMADTRRHRHYVALSLCQGATVTAHEVDLSPAEADELAGLFAWLVRQGQVACAAVQPASAMLGLQEMLEALRQTLGGLVVDANLAAGSPPQEPAPAFLLPVWPFDHDLGGQPASTGVFLGLDLELVASPSPDEEVGFPLPGRAGLWVVHARPLCSTDLGRQSPSTAQ